MAAGRCLFYIAITLVIGACNLRRPEVTLTLVPIETRTAEATDVRESATETRVAQNVPTPTIQSSPTDVVIPTFADTAAPTLTATNEPTSTVTVEPSLTSTDLPTVTETPLPTATVTLSSTATDTMVPTATATMEPTVPATVVASSTHTPVPTPTPRPSPTRILPRTATATEVGQAKPDVEASATPTAIRELVVRSAGTATVPPTVTISRTLPPTLTPLPTLNATELAGLLATPSPRATLPVTWTAVPTSLQSALPVLSTPLLASATEGADRRPASTQFQSTSQPEFGAATFTPTFTPTRIQPTVVVRQDLIVEQIPPPVFAPSTFSTLGASVYQYDVGFGQPFDYQGLQLRGGVVLFTPNPAASDSYLRTDQVGMLWYRPINVANEGAMSYSPFHEGFSVPSSDDNKNRVVEIDWSADGTQFTFRIDTPPGQDNVNAGVWFWQRENVTPTDPTYPVIRDCVTAGYISCQIVKSEQCAILEND